MRWRASAAARSVSCDGSPCDTAACEWILRGVPLTTVQAWLGHGSIQITARYLHHLGDSADRAALQLLNDAAAKPTEPARSVAGVIPG